MRFNIILFQNRKLADRVRCVKIVLVLLAGIVAIGLLSLPRAIGTVAAAQDGSPSAAGPRTIFEQYCYVCHGLESPQAGMSLERLATQGVTGDNFQQWQKVATALEQKVMPPKGMPQPSAGNSVRRSPGSEP
jgi:hypothetical protein